MAAFSLKSEPQSEETPLITITAGDLSLPAGSPRDAALIPICYTALGAELPDQTTCRQPSLMLFSNVALNGSASHAIPTDISSLSAAAFISVALRSVLCRPLTKRSSEATPLLWYHTASSHYSHAKSALSLVFSCTPSRQGSFDAGVQHSDVDCAHSMHTLSIQLRA